MTTQRSAVLLSTAGTVGQPGRGLGKRGFDGGDDAAADAFEPGHGAVQGGDEPGEAVPGGQAGLGLVAGVAGLEVGQRIVVALAGAPGPARLDDPIAVG